MPLLQEMDENGGYKILLEHTFSELMQPNPQVPNGALAGFTTHMKLFFAKDLFLWANPFLFSSHL